MFLKKGNGHQIENRRRALAFTLANLDGVERIDESTVVFPPYGTCRFSAYADANGAMISTPYREDNEFGSVDWHHLGRIMMFRDFVDGTNRVMIYVCPIKPLFGLRTIGAHGVKWPDVDKVAEFKKVFRAI
jgi:hypothetical protein